LNWVAFWHPDWKRHLFAELDHAIAIGANGVYLDEFDAVPFRLRSDPGCSRGLADGVDLEGEMRRLVQEIRAYVDSRVLDRRFYLVAFDGRALYKKYRDAVEPLDGIIGEHMYFVGWNLADFMNGPEQPWRTDESTAFVRAMAGTGLAVFDLEYITDPARIQRLAELAATSCFLPSLSEQKILVVSKPKNLMHCDDARCMNNSVVLSARDPARCPMQLVAAVLPGSRSVRVGTTATAYASVINSGPRLATGCRISAATSVPGAFSFRATDPATNEVAGATNASFSIEPGGLRTFVVGLTPSIPLSPTDLQLDVVCANAGPARVQSGVNTLLVSSSAGPGPDIVALAATMGGNGIVETAGPRGAGAFAVATVNVGAAATITVSADTGGRSLPVGLAVCETDPMSGGCLASPAAAVTTEIVASATPTFAVFVQGVGTTPFAPASNRIFVRFKDAGGVIRGSTSVAVRTR
jgi:hypothetical protein